MYLGNNIGTRIGDKIMPKIDISTATSTSYSIASVCKTCDEGNYKVRINGTGACASNSITSN